MKVVKNSERLFLNDCPISVGGNKTYPPVVKNTLPPTPMRMRGGLRCRRTRPPGVICATPLKFYRLLLAIQVFLVASE